MIDHGRPGPDPTELLIGLDSIWQLPPMDEIVADRMAPTVRAPGDADSVVLIEQMPFASDVHKPLGSFNQLIREVKWKRGRSSSGSVWVEMGSLLARRDVRLRKIMFDVEHTVASLFRD